MMWLFEILALKYYWPASPNFIERPRSKDAYKMEMWRCGMEAQMLNFRRLGKIP